MPETGAEQASRVRPPWRLAVADVNWFTTENLFRELDDPVVTILALRCMDYLNGVAEGNLSLVEVLPVTALGQQLPHPRPRPAQRLDEAFPEAGNAADRPGDRAILESW